MNNTLDATKVTEYKRLILAAKGNEKIEDGIFRYAVNNDEKEEWSAAIEEVVAAM